MDKTLGFGLSVSGQVWGQAGRGDPPGFHGFSPKFDPINLLINLDNLIMYMFNKLGGDFMLEELGRGQNSKAE